MRELTYRGVLGGVSRLVGLGILSVAVQAGAWAAPKGPTSIEVWHALTGVHETTFKELVDRFNAEQDAVQVKLERKGNETETLNAGLDALRTKNAPELIQASDEGGMALAAVKGGLQPIGPLWSRAAAADAKAVLPGVASFAKDAKGSLVGFPYFSAAPLLYYNRDAYRSAGLDPNQAPRTWRDLQAHLLKLHAVSACPYATSRQSWVHLENLATWHGAPIASGDNGWTSAHPRLMMSGLLHVRHLAAMRSWVSGRLFIHQSEGDESDAKFLAGECAVLTGGSQLLGSLAEQARFDWAVAAMPFWEEETREPGASVIGGSALWATGGKKRETSQAVGRFLAFLGSPAVAAEWHRKTGFLPLTSSAVRAASAGDYEKWPGFAAEMRRLAQERQSRARGLRAARHQAVRGVFNEELSAAWSGRKPPKQALDDAMREGDAVLKKR